MSHRIGTYYIAVIYGLPFLWEIVQCALTLVHKAFGIQLPRCGSLGATVRRNRPQWYSHTRTIKWPGSYIQYTNVIWWRHQMETLSALLAICSGNSPAPGEFPSQRPVTRSSDVFFDMRLNKWLSKQSCGWWLETLSYSLWRHCNEGC